MIKKVKKKKEEEGSIESEEKTNQSINDIQKEVKVISRSSTHSF